MASIEVDKLNDEELEGLSAQIADEKKKRAGRKRAEARKTIAELAARHSINLTELATRPVKGKTQAEVRYRNPDDDYQTWAGKGRKPKWLMDRLAAGATLETFEIP